jgi:hypothetical protein
MTPDELHKKAVAAFANKPFSKAIDAVLAVALEEAADAVGEVGDHADAGAYINAIRAMINKNKNETL